MGKESTKSGELLKKVHAYIKKYHMIQPGDKIIVGLSGGADSVCLFYMLLALREVFSISVEAAHINHMIRKTAQRDEDFVKELCEKERVELHVCRADVGKLAEREKMSVEEAGRKIRYGFFEEVAQKTAATGIAVAHHADDVAETVLFHLCRGTGLDGLCGIRPVREKVIRPLLCLSRAEIEEYLEQIQAGYVTDETNAERTYVRNRIRHDVLPLLEQEVCHGASEHIARTGELVLLAQSFLQEQICAAAERFVNIRKGQGLRDATIVCLDLSSLSELHLYLQGELIRFCIGRLCDGKKDISAGHVDAVFRLKDSQVGRTCNLPGGIWVRRSYKELIFSKECCRLGQAEQFCVTLEKSDLEAGMEIFLPDGKKVVMRVKQFDKNACIPTKAYTKWVDYDKIEGPIQIRTPREGDFFYFNDKNRKYVKDYMVNEKIPLDERGSSILLADGNHMLYFVGKRISDRIKIDDHTKKILDIIVAGG